MRYILKRDVPASFTNKTHGLKSWSEYHECCFKQKQALKKYILTCEQNMLCIYCESKISISKESSHFEHIRPKAKNMYPELTFDYKNLAISCNGTCSNQENDNKKYNCGHVKEGQYDEEKFLHPFEVTDIAEYFKYDFDDFKIYPTDKNKEKAKYMIDTLNLNSSTLVVTRRNDYKKFNKRMRKIRDIPERKLQIKKEIQSYSIQFFSFFKYKFNHLL
jgi:uncharacterized protein (TIGR02646 family)